MIQELIVVEGKNDAQAVRRALGPVDVLWTEGFGLTEAKLNYIAQMAAKRGVIVLTDPDTAGRQIREQIRERVPEAKHVFLPRQSAVRDRDIGVEHASPEALREAFARVLAEPKAEPHGQAQFEMQDLIKAGLAGAPAAAVLRSRLGRRLGLGDTNAKQLVHRLNRFGISREEFRLVVEEIRNGDGT